MLGSQPSSLRFKSIIQFQVRTMDLNRKSGQKPSAVCFWEWEQIVGCPRVSPRCSVAGKRALGFQAPPEVLPGSPLYLDGRGLRGSGPAREEYSDSQSWTREGMEDASFLEVPTAAAIEVPATLGLRDTSRAPSISFSDFRELCTQAELAALLPDV